MGHRNHTYLLVFRKLQFEIFRLQNCKNIAWLKNYSKETVFIDPLFHCWFTFLVCFDLFILFLTSSSSIFIPGPRCDLCSDGYYGDPSNQQMCLPCECNGNVDMNAVGNCNRTTGDCLKCIYNTGGPQCDTCLPG